jgi:hypothetical protein
MPQKSMEIHRKPETKRGRMTPISFEILDDLTIKSNLDEKDGRDGETLHGFCLRLMGDDLNTP